MRRLELKTVTQVFISIMLHPISQDKGFTANNKFKIRQDTILYFFYRSNMLRILLCFVVRYRLCLVGKDILQGLLSDVLPNLPG